MRAKWLGRRSGLAFAAAVAAAACGVHTTSSGGIKVVSVSPNTGSVAGGPQVTITGSGFTDNSGHANVSFGSGTVVGDVVNDTTIHVPMPGSLACGKVDVQVANSHGDGILFNGFDYTGGTGLLTITGITPNNGDVAGGTPITITGSGFSGGVGVSIGGELLTNVVVVNDTTITAVTPAHANGGAADLIARNCAHQVQAPAAFTFTTGLNGGALVLYEYHYPDPAQFSNNPSDSLYPFAAYYQPSATDPLPAIPSSGACQVVNDVYPPETEIDGGPSVTWASGAASLTLAQQTTASGTYFEYYEPGPTGFPQNDSNTGTYVANQPYTFTSAGSTTVPAFSTSAAFLAPSAIVFNAATTTLLFTGNGSTTPPSTVTTANGMAFGWTAGTQQGDVVMIQLDGYNDAAQYQKSIRCTAPDTGSFTIPATSLGMLAGASQAVVNVDRRRVTTFLNGGNGSLMTALTGHEQSGVVLLK